jgi:hypothetical protein
MEWASEISFSVYNDAWMTFNTHYNSNKIITCDVFRQCVENGDYIKYNLKDIINDEIENLNVKRLLATSINTAYSDRPRGINDIKSVKYHMKNKYTSPCIIVNFQEKLILLDGMHRLVAASLSGKRKIAILMVTID